MSKIDIWKAFPDEIPEELVRETQEDLSPDDFELMWTAAKLWYDFSGRLNKQRTAKYFDGETDRLVVTCPACNGSGEDGQDRCLPPNPYVCEVCDGYGKVEILPAKVAEKGNASVVCLACAKEEMIPAHEALPHGWETVEIPNTPYEYPVCGRECREWVLMLQQRGELQVTLPEDQRRK